MGRLLIERPSSRVTHARLYIEPETSSGGCGPGRPPTELDQKFVVGGSDQEVDLVIIFLVIIAIAWMRKG